MPDSMVRIVRMSAAILSLPIIVWMISSMLELPLWGYRPLVLNLALWVLLQSIVLSWWYKGEKALYHFGLSSLSGFLLYFSFPDFVSSFLIFVAWVPLLLVDSRIEKVRQVLPYAFNTFLVWNITTVFWLVNTDVGAAIFTFILNSLLMTLAFAIYAFMRRRLPGRYAPVLLISTWVSFELFHFAWEISFPWLTLGNVWGRHPWVVQWYASTGVFGGTIWALLVNWILFQAFAQKGSALRHLAAALVVITVPILISFAMHFDESQGEKIRVGVIQPNFEPHYEKFDIPESIQAQRFVALSESIADEVDLLFYPETSLRIVLGDTRSDLGAFEEVDDFLRKHPELELITGVDAVEWTDANDPSPNVRPYVTPRGTRYWKVYNAALLFRGQVDKDAQLYKKSKLVPGAEKFPYSKLFPFMEPIVNRLGGSTYGFETQDKRTPMQTSHGAIGVAICYESIYGEHVGGYIREGAQALAVITNDGWWDRTSGHRQHLRLSSLRAIEQRKWIARSANSGISCFIDPSGKIIDPTDYDEEAAVAGEIYLNEVITPYARWGNLIARIALYFFLFSFLAAFAKWVIPRRD